MNDNLRHTPKTMSGEYPKYFIKDFVSGKEQFVIRKKVLTAYPVHWHDFFELEMIISGEAEMVLNGKTFRLKEGDIYLLTPTDFHKITPLAENTVIYNLMLADELLSDEMLFYFTNKESNIVCSLNKKDYDFLSITMERIIDEVNGKGLFSATYIRDLTECIFILLSRNVCISSEDYKLSENPVSRALTFLSRRFRYDPSLEETADEVGLNPGYFSSLFHSAVGKTYKQYLNELKLGYAKKLIISGNLSITDICFNSGYNSLSHFLRVFKKEYGCSPHEMRKNSQSLS